LKYVGKTAVAELDGFRPYKNPEDLLVSPSDGRTWRHTKFNKRALETLLKLEALDTMGMVGPEKMFENYRQAHAVLIGKYDEIKRAAARKKRDVVEVKTLIAELATKEKGLEDWTRTEKIEATKELAGSVDMDLVVPQSVRDNLSTSGFLSVDEWSEKGNYWGIVQSAAVATTKTGKHYLKIKLLGPDTNSTYQVFVWGWKSDSTSCDLRENDIIVGLFDRSDFGFTTFQAKIFKVGVLERNNSNNDNIH
jgi:DNA polymerase III alpha subunit